MDKSIDQCLDFNLRRQESDGSDSTKEYFNPRNIFKQNSSSSSDPIASPSNDMSDCDFSVDPSIASTGSGVLSKAGGTLGHNKNPSAALPIRSIPNSIQVRLNLLEKQFMMQKEVLSKQFEAQCRLLDNEQQAKVQEYLKVIIAQQQQEQHKQQEEDNRMQVDSEQLIKLKNKRKTEESAVASTAVKLKLRECLLNKNRLEGQISTESTPGSSQWSSVHHSSLENHSPPRISKWSPPLSLLNQLDDEYPLRKTVSEPTLKIKTCKISLRQRVMQRNSQLMRKRELYRKKSMVNCGHIPSDLDSSPNSPSVIDSHSSSIDESKTPVSMNTTKLSESYLSKINFAGTHVADPLSAGHYGSLPQVRDATMPILTQELIKNYNTDIYNSSNNTPPNKKDDLFDYHNYLVTGSTCDVRSHAPSMPPSNIFSPNISPETYLQAIMLARSSLPRTRSEPIPLSVQLLLQQRMLRKQDLKDPTKFLLKQKLLQQANAKKHMGNLDESIEHHLLNHQGMKMEDDVMILEEEEICKEGIDDLHDVTLLPQHSLDFDVLSSSSNQSSPTGIVFDTTMLKHACTCNMKKTHPENPDRLVAILSLFIQQNLISKCRMIKPRKAMCEELQTCHSETYVNIYACNSRSRNCILNESFESRLVKMSCGGLGVDSDTVWNNEYTSTAARIAAGSVIELSHKVAKKEVRNGFALVRPPGHHAEDTVAMGFCYFNSMGVAVKQLLDKTSICKILILDWDVHHGNSTQQIFYADPRVLFISLHRYDDGNFFPGTGDPSECGIYRGIGHNVNISFSNASMSDADYLAAFRSIVMPLAMEFQPEIVMVSAGFDASYGHPAPLGGYSLSAACFGYMTKELMTLCDERVVLVLEGGYELGPLARCASQCLKALLHLPLEEISSIEMNKRPCQQATYAINTTISYHESFWPQLRHHSGNIDISHSDYLRHISR